MSVRLVVALAALSWLGCSEGAAEEAREADAQPEVAPVACLFNADCPATARCECTSGECTCREGPRGTGKSGVDRCADGLDCETGLCVEGPEGGDGSYCSGPCSDGCTGALPTCSDVATLGPICVRAPPPSGATGTLAGASYAFADAFFGHDLADAGATATALELHAGWSGGCPPPTSDPKATIVVSGLPGSLAEGSASGISATLLGFVPSLPITSKATSVSLRIDHVEPCSGRPGACALDLTVSFAFAEGTIAGAVHATRCASMDETP